MDCQVALAVEAHTTAALLVLAILQVHLHPKAIMVGQMLVLTVLVAAVAQVQWVQRLQVIAGVLVVMEHQILLVVHQ
jgi:hypothetical protein